MKKLLLTLCAITAFMVATPPNAVAATGSDVATLTQNPVNASDVLNYVAMAFAFVAVGLFLHAATNFEYRYKVLNKKPGTQLNNFTPSIWSDALVKKLWKLNKFLDFCEDESQYTTGGVAVHRPVSGTIPTVTKNATVFPAQYTTNSDSDIYYSLDTFRTNPTVVPQQQIDETNYDMLADVQDKHVKKLSQDMADSMLYRWVSSIGATANQVRTTGASRNYSAPGASGLRKKLTLSDLREASLIMDNNNIPVEGRYCLLTPQLIKDLMEDTEISKFDYNRLINMEENALPFLAGFTILKRSTVNVYDNSGTPVAKDIAGGAATASTDNAAGLCWQKDCVSKAQGQVHAFIQQNHPGYYGTVQSYEARLGGRIVRAEGVVSLIETATS